MSLNKVTCPEVPAIMIEFLYGDLPAEKRKSLRKHMDRCAQCRQEWQSFQSVITIVEQSKHVEPGDEYWAGYWQNVEAKLNKQPVAIFSFYRQKPLMRRMVQAAVAALLLITGIFLGKQLGNDPAGTEQQAATPVLSQEARARTVKYLEQSKILLLGIVNLDNENEGEPTDLSLQSGFSRRLVKEAAELKSDLRKAHEATLLNLVGQLEMILMQIANLEETYDLESVDIIRSSIEQQGVLFKIHLSELDNKPADLPLKEKQDGRPANEL